MKPTSLVKFIFFILDRNEKGQGYRTSDIDTGRPIYILDVRYIYLSSYIYIGCPIYILDVLYIYWTSDIDFGNIGCILS